MEKKNEENIIQDRADDGGDVALFEVILHWLDFDNT